MELNTCADTPAVVIWPYGHADAADTLAIFLAAVTETAAADYSPEQIQAWARPEAREISAWHAAMQARSSYVATLDGTPAGFSDVDSEGHIDMMFVAPRYLRRGVARQLIDHVEARARQEQLTQLTADVSITARPFFERSGFTVEAEQHPVTAGVQLTNFKMKKKLLGGEVRLSGHLVCHTQDQAETVRKPKSSKPEPEHRSVDRVGFRDDEPLGPQVSGRGLASVRVVQFAAITTGRRSMWRQAPPDSGLSVTSV